MRARSGVLAILAAGVVSGLSCREPTRAASAGGVALEVAAPPAVLQALDSGRVLVRGPTNRNVSAAPGQTVTIDNLTPGTYSVALEGFSVTDVAYFGQTSGITVVAGQNTPASVNFLPFEAHLPVFPDTFWIGTQVTVGIDPLAGATSYQIDWSPDSTFATGTNNVPVSGLTGQITVPSYGRYFVLIRAVDPFGTAGVPGPALGIWVVPAGPARRLEFTGQPSTAASGSPIAPAVTVTVQDSLGNTVVGYTDNVTVALGTNPAGGTLSGTTTVAAGAGVATFSTLTIDKAATGYTLAATAAGVAGGATSTAFDVQPGATATKLAFTIGPTPTQLTPAGFTIPPFQVVAHDAGGNVVTGFAGDVTLSITPGTGTPGTVLGGTTTMTASSGVASFANLVIDSAGVGYTLTATASGVDGDTSGAFNIVPRLVFITQPQTTLARGVLPEILVVAQDGGDHTVTGFTDSIRIVISSGSGTLGATLSGTVEQAADTGVVRFSDLSIDALGTDYTLMITAATGASYGGADSALSEAFNVTLQFVFATQPTTTGNYTNLTPAVQVAAHNGLGATESTFQGDISLGLLPGTGAPGATLLGSTTVTANTGVATFPGLNIDLPGAGYRLQALGNPMAGLLGDSSDAFDIACAANCWTVETALPTPRHDLGVGVLNGVLYAIGGTGATSYDTVEAWDPGMNTWTPRASMVTPREGAGIGVVNGLVYAAGGFYFSQLDTVEAYDPGNDTWSPRAKMPTARSTFGTGVLNGLLYAAGGFDAGGPSPALEAYDPVANTWSVKAPMDSARNRLGVGVINGTLYAVGGGSSLAVEAYDPGNNTWSLRAPMLFPQVEFAVGVLGGKLYAVGGYGGRLEVYDPQTDTWTEKAPLPAQRVDFGIGVVNGLLYVVGGSDGMNDIAEVWAYHP